jgi:hypothetical protein
MLDEVESLVIEAQRHEHSTGLTSHRTRELPRGIVSLLHHWQSRIPKDADHGATLSDRAE